MSKTLKKEAGLTLIELIIAMSIFAIITQQIKAMTGDTEGRPSGNRYGVHFETDKYVLFNGTYTAGEPSNFEVPLESTLSFTGITGDGNIIFEQGSGELLGTSGVTIQDSLNNDQKVIQLNNFGVVTDVN
ncbi:MAG: hypothetical protein UU80_C0015G0020 [candidate division WWE3 bacterium GW2011_GWA1_41_8]|uniref:Prepilin-type N-terminal cleavage/methylation domain-containing protein n=1 Tax=candidate division WWE3 bacterium GW2011_GWA1_41_8 TaxID=1619103 RepID=A0A0G0XAS9_UNCKA|nr:MAG: hypothetical protein UU80_C0015G0020 [candidate division WWE3 bacterium GW2011_GWA1_41_8]